jgi:dTDP-glucose 4,6-dehydratase
MIFVIGGAGFIGSSFVRKIDNPVIYDKLTYAGRLENIRDIKHIFIKGDVASTNLEDSIKKYKPDVLVNFAAESHVDRSINNPYNFINTNINGPVNVLELQRKYDFKYIHISTDEVYGEGDASESSPIDPSSPYSSSKASADLFIKSYIRTYGVNAVIIRPSNAYGIRQYPEKLIPKAIIRSIMNLSVPVYGKGEQKRNWIYVEDLVNVIKDITFKGKKGEIYNVAGNEIKTNIEMLELINKYIPVKIEHVHDRPGHDQIYKMKNSKLNYKTTPVEDGIKNTVEWYKNNKWWWESLIKDEYFTRDEPWNIKP